MMKKRLTRKLTLHRETLRYLDDPEQLRQAAAGNTSGCTNTAQCSVSCFATQCDNTVCCF
jgi:hypothetical protein